MKAVIASFAVTASLLAGLAFFRQETTRPAKMSKEEWQDQYDTGYKIGLRGDPCPGQVNAPMLQGWSSGRSFWRLHQHPTIPPAAGED